MSASPAGGSPRRKLAFAALVTVSALLALELAARLVLAALADPPPRSVAGGPGWLDRLARDLNSPGSAPDLYLPDPHLLWRLRAEQTLDLPISVYETRSAAPNWRLTINRDGFRGPVYPDAPSGPVIVTVGDSCTFGFRVDDDETYPRQLQNWLRRNGHPSTTVVNLGVPGYSSFQGRRLLTRLLERHTPTAVVIAFGANDLEIDAHPDRDKAARLNLSRLRLLYRTERLGIVQLARRLAGEATRTEPRALPTKTVRRVPLPEMAGNLRAMVAAARAAGATVILVDQVFVTAELRYTLERVAREEGVPFIDGRETLRAGLGRLDDEPELAAAGARIDSFWREEVVSYRPIYYGQEFYAELFADPQRSALLRYFMVEPVHANALGNRLLAEAVGTSLLATGLTAR